jgi:hypothetical protein
MKISLDQAITATGCVAFSSRGVASCTIIPAKGHHGHDKQRNVAQQILAWMSGLERQYPLDPISHVALEEFVKFVPRDRVDSMMKVREFTGYLWAQLENWAIERDRLIVIDSISKGNISKEKAAIIARGCGFRGATEHEIDAFHQGLLAGYDR